MDLVISDGMKRVLDAIKEKTQKAQDLYKNLTENVNSVYNVQHKEFNQTIERPKFI